MCGLIETTVSQSQWDVGRDGSWSAHTSVKRVRHLHSTKKSFLLLEWWGPSGASFFPSKNVRYFHRFIEFFSRYDVTASLFHSHCLNGGVSKDVLKCQLFRLKSLNKQKCRAIKLACCCARGQTLWFNTYKCCQKFCIRSKKQCATIAALRSCHLSLSSFSSPFVQPHTCVRCRTWNCTHLCSCCKA